MDQMICAAEPAVAHSNLSRGSVIAFDRDRFQADFNRRHFGVAHVLGNHPDFALPRLVELAAEMARERPKDIHCDVGAPGIGEKWRDIAPGALPVDEIVRTLETQHAWIVLFRVERHPRYAALLDQAMSDILELTSPEMERQIKKREVILFITSPRRVTTFHIDRECNFLLQIRGDKDISIFPRGDREVVSEEELETFWTADNNAPHYRPEFEGRADHIRLRPGEGVHIPINAPHWLRNLDSVSVSASFNFQFRDRVRANLYRANYYLRKFGFRPSPPFRGAASDAAKAVLGGGLYKVRQMIHGRDHRD